MKCYRRLAFFLAYMFSFLMLFCIQPKNAFSEPQSYPLICRVGKGLSAQTYSNAAPRTFDGKPSKHRQFLRIKYKRSLNAAKNQAPNPGECTWVDRPLRADEPTEAMLVSRLVRLNIFIGGGRGYTAGIVVDSASNSQEATKAKIEWQYIIDRIRKDKIFGLKVYNDNAGTMIITGIEQ